MISKNRIDPSSQISISRQYLPEYQAIRHHNRQTDATTTKLKLMELSLFRKKKLIPRSQIKRTTDKTKKKLHFQKPLSTFIYSLSFWLSIFA